MTTPDNFDTDDLPYSQLVNRLPRTLQARFYSLGPYLLEIAQEEAANIALEPQRLREVRESLQLTGMMFALYSLFRSGSASARGAARLFHELDARGFSVGSAHFTPEGEMTLAGDRLADRLKEAIPDPFVRSLFRTDYSLRVFVRRFLLGVKNGYRAD
jgi:hypothetical protein